MQRDSSAPVVEMDATVAMVDAVGVAVAVAGDEARGWGERRLLWC